MKSLKNIAIAILTILVITSCKKDDGLTKPTQIGANTFSCKINGKTFVTKSTLFGPDPIFVGYYTGANPRFIIEGSNNSSQPYISIRMEVDGIITKGTYMLENSPTFGSLEYRYPNDLYKTTSGQKGEVTFTRVDPSAKIYSGTFSFSAVNSAGGIINVTNGRFDVKVQ
ncbi:MAG: DUF6252 family protein [Daejeonella sp.]